MSRQGFGGDDDGNENDIERLLEGLQSAKQWYDNNRDLFDRLTGDPGGVDLAGGEPVSEAHVDEDRVLIVADVTGTNATELNLKFYDGKVKGKLGDRKFSVNVPNDVIEDSIEADMKNGVLRVDIERENASQDETGIGDINVVDDDIPTGEDSGESKAGGGGSDGGDGSDAGGPGENIGGGSDTDSEEGVGDES